MNRKEYISRLEECHALNVIFQLTDKCVLSCKYCFAKGTHRDKVSTFNDSILELAIKQAFETRHKHVTFEWTGGEPLLVGLDFFKKVIFYQKKYATKSYHNGVQTSGNLLDTTLIDFLLENDFSISTTIDGVEEAHNKNRPTNKNTPSFSNVQKTRQYIQDKGYDCGFICTITKNNLGTEKKMLDFIRSQKIQSFHCNPYIYYSKNKVKDSTIALSNTDYSKFFISEFNAWVEGGKLHPIPITISDIIKCLTSNKPISQTICTYGGRCLSNFIAIIPNGDVYNCPKFTGSENMKLGNITTQDINSILSYSSPKMNNLIDQRVKAINNCFKTKCKFFFICNGGCPYHSFIASNGENVSYTDCLCEGKKTVYQYLNNVIECINHSSE